VGVVERISLSATGMPSTRSSRAPDIPHAALSEVSDHTVAAGKHFAGCEDIGGRRGNDLEVGPKIFFVGHVFRVY
jgi:hypothetical protein